MAMRRVARPREATGGDGGTQSEDDPRPLAIVLSSFAYCVVEQPGDVRSYDDPDPCQGSQRKSPGST